MDIPSGWQVDNDNDSDNNNNDNDNNDNDNNDNNDNNDSDSDTYIIPSVLVSLTLPKLCALKILPNNPNSNNDNDSDNDNDNDSDSDGISHYLGGRFVPPSLIEKYNLDVPQYTNADQIIRLH